VWKDKILKENLMNTTVKNILIAVGVGIVVGVLLGAFMPGANATVSVGAAIGITFALLQSQSRKS
jgi:TctA family transporter